MSAGDLVGVTGPNMVPGRCRGVAVAWADCPFDEESLRAHFLGREAYWKTRFLVVRRPTVRPEEETTVALLRVTRASDDELFSPVTAVELLAGPSECALMVRRDLDTAIPSLLATAARGGAPGVRSVVVQGRYEHVNFIVDPRPLTVTVREVVPPYPAKLLDQAQRILDVTEDLPPMRLESELVDFADLARRYPAEHYLLPCRGGGGEIPGARLSYLDERPGDSDWALLGCERSRQIHRWFYGRDAPGIDFCPKKAPVGDGGGAVLTKCCLQQEELDEGSGAGIDWVSVPWGSSLGHVGEALRRLARRREPSWSPA